jgi:hypothetical protein
VNDGLSDLLALTSAELLEAHRRMDTVDVPRTVDGERLSISQRVEQLVGAYRIANAALIESLHTR